MKEEIGHFDDTNIYPLEAGEGGRNMSTNKSRGIALFDLENTPEDFDPDMLFNERMGMIEFADLFGYRLGMRRYALIYVSNPIGDKFFYSRNGFTENDCCWDFAERGFYAIPNYDSIPQIIKKNAIEFFLETKDFYDEKDRNVDDEDFYKRVGCGTRAGTLLGGCYLKEHIEDRKNFSLENVDFILFREYVFSDDDHNSDPDLFPNSDAEIVGNISYSVWAGGRYFMRIRCLSAKLSESDKDSLDNHIEAVLSDGWFRAGRFWLNP